MRPKYVWLSSQDCPFWSSKYVSPRIWKVFRNGKAAALGATMPNGMGIFVESLSPQDCLHLINQFQLLQGLDPVGEATMLESFPPLAPEFGRMREMWNALSHEEKQALTEDLVGKFARNA